MVNQAASKGSLSDFEHPSVTVDNVIFRVEGGALNILLIQRKESPFEQDWALPGGFVNPNEALDAAARRELEEETGVRDVVLEQVQTFGEPGRDPRGWVISVAYMALLSPERRVVMAGDDAVNAHWFGIENLPTLAFDHRRIIECAHDTLRRLVQDTDAAFRLLPAEFTLTDLQQTYEIVLGESLDKRNFRRKVLQARILQETGRRRSGDGRPARTYRYNPQASDIPKRSTHL